MKIPRELVIGDSIWKLRFVRKFDGEKENEFIHGMCCPDTKEILIRTNARPRDRLETFIHEVAHAIEDEYNIDIGHPLIKTLEKALADFLRDNFLGVIK